MTPADAGRREALIAAVRKAADQPMMSERKALAIAVGVLGVVRAMETDQKAEEMVKTIPAAAEPALDAFHRKITKLVITTDDGERTIGWHGGLCADPTTLLDEIEDVLHWAPGASSNFQAAASFESLPRRSIADDTAAIDFGEFIANTPLPSP